MRPVLAIAVILVAMPASAQVYKWVDERGMTNYSNKPPVNPDNAKNVKLVLDKVTFGSPDKVSARAAEQANQRALADKIDRLERALEAEREARHQAAVAASLAPASACSGRDDCYAAYGDYRAPPVAFAPFPGRHFRAAPPFFAPGVIAGNVNGLNGVTAGNVNGLRGITAGNVNGLTGVTAGNSLNLGSGVSAASGRGSRAR